MLELLAKAGVVLFLAAIPADTEKLALSENLTDVIREVHFIHDPPDPNHRAWLDLYIKEILVQSAERGIDPLIPLTIAQHESHFRFWARSPSEEFCGMFQQAARYSHDPPLPGIGASRARCEALGWGDECDRVRRPCRHVEECRQECDRLTDPAEFRYAVTQMMDFLTSIRSRWGNLRGHICNYQGGLYRPCGEVALGYQQRHESHRVQVERIWARAGGG